ncbi:MAG: hypothetical protein WCJ35_23550 [Planctomycetota bacterium]
MPRVALEAASELAACWNWTVADEGNDGRGSGTLQQGMSRKTGALGGKATTSEVARSY